MRPASFALAAALLASCDTREPSRPANEASAPVQRLAPFDCEFASADPRKLPSFVHATGAAGDKLLPETMGSGVALLDFDSNGTLDLYLVNSGVWRGAATAVERTPRDGEPTCALWRGQGNGTFERLERVTELALFGMGASVADFDADGDDDVLVTALGDFAVLRNERGLDDAAEETGLHTARWRDLDGALHPEWSTASAWFDVENDGDLDLFVANYVQWTRETEIFTTLDGATKAFTTPERYAGLPCRLYVNDGRANFADASESAGLLGLAGKALGLALWDFDDDGLLDVVVANDTQPNFLLLNRSRPGAPKFEERGLAAGIAYDETGRARAGMGIDIAQLAPGDAPSVAIGNFAGEPMSLYRWRSDGTFQANAATAGVALATTRPLTFGLAFFDADLDGALDLVLANGHIEPDIARFAPDQSSAQAPLLFRGRGDGTFEDATALAGQDFRAPRVARGLAYGDFDGDGDLDLVLTTSGGGPAILLNRAQQIRPRHFLRVDLRGKGANTRAIGARVTLLAGGVAHTRYVRTGSSYLSQSELTLTFGLGDTARVDELRIRWPGGPETTHAIDAIDRTLVIEQP